MTNFPLWADRLFNTPVALSAFKNDALVEFVNQRVFGAKAERIDAVSLDARNIRSLSGDAMPVGGNGRDRFKADGQIAVVNVHGTLVHRTGYLDAESGLVSYSSIVNQVRAAHNDSDIRGTFISYDSGGGECSGLFAAAEELAMMTKAEGGKPIYAYLDERACSAAYVMASTADKIFGRRECQGGSIAAICNVIDKSKAYEKAGLEPVIIRPEWADRKARGQAGEKIDPETIAALGAIVDEASNMVVEMVCAMRGLSEKAIKELRGEVFTGTDLLRHNLIDDIVSEREAWDALLAEARK